MNRFITTAAICLALAGCDVDLASDMSEGALLVPDGEGRDGKVLMLSPGSDSVIQINRADKAVSRIDVGNLPRTLERPEGSDVVYTLEPQDGTITRIGLDGIAVTQELGGPFNRLEWAPDGMQAVAVFDDSLGNVDINELGSLNPNAVALLTDDGETLSIRQYTLTFPPEQVTFDVDSTKALISTRARLHVLDLETLEERAIPFSQEDGVERRPSLVAPSSDGTRALVAVQGQSDLFVVSLDPVLIENVIGLTRAPSALAWSGDDATAAIADNTSVVTFLDLESFETEALNVGHPVTTITVGGGVLEPFALLYSATTTQPRLSRVSLSEPGAPDAIDTWLLEDGIRSLYLEPGGTAAVVFHDGNSFGSTLGAQSLSLFSFTERGPSRIFLDAPATDLHFLEAGEILTSEAPHVMVVLELSGRIVRYNLWTYEQVVLDTYERPLAIGALPPGDQSGESTNRELFVVHAQNGGLVSFLPPDATEVPPGGWPAVSGLTGRDLLDRR
ncbi:MAG: hypothetical protein KDA24_26930 [Deltaproteobacteria bacterium]|nr:hypothetical protein [Deltaproteobacteria bacterium]